MTVRFADRTATAIRAASNWLFRDRKSGRIVIAQFPNLALLVWMVATLLNWFVHGRTRTLIGVIGTIALVVWAGDEVVRGVNPWRRMLGAAVGSSRSRSRRGD